KKRMQISKPCCGLVSGNTTTVRLGHSSLAGPVAQWITRLTTDQKILGSTAGSAASSFDRTLGGSARSALALWSSVLSLGPFAGALGLDVVSSQCVRRRGRPSSY